MEFGPWVAELLEVCQRLPGLDPSRGQHQGETHEARAVAHEAQQRLEPLLRDASAGWSDVYAATSRLIVDLVQSECVDRSRQSIEAQAQTVRVLQHACAAVADGREDDAAAMRERNLGTVREELWRHGAGLREAFGRLGAPDWLEWAREHGASVSEACLGTLHGLRASTAVPDNAPQWYGVGVLPAHDLTLVRGVAATGGAHAVLPCPPLALVPGLDRLVVVATATAEGRAILGLRLARAVHAVLECAARLPAPSVPPPADEWDEEDEEAEWDEELEDEEPAWANGAPSPHLLANLRLVDQVDRALQRDYVVLSVLLDELEVMRVVPLGVVQCVPIGQVVGRFHTLSQSVCETTLALVRRHTRASIQQAVGHVLDKSVRKCLEACPDAAESVELRYGRLPGAAASRKGVVLASERARLLMLQEVAPCVVLMRGNSRAFAGRWFPSRSAKSHARRRRAHAPGGPVQ